MGGNGRAADIVVRYRGFRGQTHNAADVDRRIHGHIVLGEDQPDIKKLFCGCLRLDRTARDRAIADRASAFGSPGNPARLYGE